jgi:RecB family endonuclease NucS
MTLPKVQSDLAQALTKDPYYFDFISIREKYDEKELKDALMDNISRLLLELGNGFAFVGREVRLDIGDTENFADMLFYNIKLHCYVVVEVKVEEFQPRDMGQLGTYMVAVNHQLKGELDGQTLGLIICKSKDNVKARYALEASSQPMGISVYDINTFLPEGYKSSLPFIEEIEVELSD